MIPRFGPRPRAIGPLLATLLIAGGCAPAAPPAATTAPAAAPTSAPSAPTTAPAAAATTAPAAAPAAAARPYAGTTLTLETYSGVPEFDFYKSLMPDFEQKTGIKVNFVQQPVAAMDEKVPLQLTAKDTTLDVFTTGSENIGHYVG
ncbi:MAG TPA: hypothetical protein VK898_12735, partial [Chloroflexota bacterium]|nr:hypothetical protein [Chloroflexota bacterium]